MGRYATIHKGCAHASADPTWPWMGLGHAPWSFWGPLRSGEWPGHQGMCGCGEPQSQRGSPILYETGEVGGIKFPWHRSFGCFVCTGLHTVAGCAQATAFTAPSQPAATEQAAGRSCPHHRSLAECCAFWDSPRYAPRARTRGRWTRTRRKCASEHVTEALAPPMHTVSHAVL